MDYPASEESKQSHGANASCILHFDGVFGKAHYPCPMLANMSFEIQKAAVIPIFVGRGVEHDSPTTEVWQTLQTYGCMDLKKLQQDLQYLRANNPKLTYRVMAIPYFLKETTN